MRLTEWERSGAGFDYRGHRIFYRRSGSGEALVLIHGFPTASWDWHKVWGGLERRFDVVAADMIGFGFSDKPRDYSYSLHDQATLHETLLEELGLTSVRLVAHDYGASVAQELLARLDERRSRQETGLAIESVCLLNGGIIPGTHRPLPIQKILAGPLGGLIAPWLTARSLRRSLRRIFGHATQPTDEEIREFWHLIEAGGGRRVVHKLIRYMAEREANRERWVGVLRTTPVPLRLINGLADPISGAHVMEAFCRLRPDAEVVGLDGIGHYPQFEAPHAVLAALLSGSELTSW